MLERVTKHLVLWKSVSYLKMKKIPPRQFENKICAPSRHEGWAVWGGGGWDGCAKPPLDKSKEAQIYLPMGVLPVNAYKSG